MKFVTAIAAICAIAMSFYVLFVSVVPPTLERYALSIGCLAAAREFGRQIGWNL